MATGAHGIILKFKKLTPGTSEGLEVRGQQVQSVTGTRSLSLNLTAACVGPQGVQCLGECCTYVFHSFACLGNVGGPNSGASGLNSRDSW